MNVDSTKISRLKELQETVIETLTELKELQEKVGYKTSDLVKKLNDDLETTDIAIELLLVTAGFKKFLLMKVVKKRVGPACYGRADFVCF